MFAVIRTGGKQYKVSAKDVLEVPKMDAKEGSSIDLEVLMTSDGKTAKIGDKENAGAKVAAKIVNHIRAPKITVFKKKRRQNYRRTKGHRQDLTVIEITDVKVA
ncbi:MAG: 50S ribosomal protein L21 [Alphaproteobacteria bacterium]|nr:50S ribosomal protein L21 [Alphaproteobacteria bacterium]